MRFGTLLAAALILLGASVHAQQGTAELRGVVFDPQQAAVPGVSVTVRNEDTGMFRETTSNTDGTYIPGGVVRFPAVHPTRCASRGRPHHHGRRDARGRRA